MTLYFTQFCLKFYKNIKQTILKQKICSVRCQNLAEPLRLLTELHLGITAIDDANITRRMFWHESFFSCLKDIQNVLVLIYTTSENISVLSNFIYQKRKIMLKKVFQQIGYLVVCCFLNIYFNSELKLLKKFNLILEAHQNLIAL